MPLKALREDVTEFENLDMEYIDTTRQMADVMTKNLSPKVHWQLVHGAHAQCADSRRHRI